ncbi:1,4-alpha-glucan branching protein [soil metagenome]
MAVGRFLLCLHSHMPYVLSHGVSPHGTDWIHESTAECYLPLLHTLDRLLQQGIRPRWTVNMTPILAEQLEDEGFKDSFEAYCEEKIAFAHEDLETWTKANETMLAGTAVFWANWYERQLRQFRERWGRSVIAAFRYFQDEGSVEMITSGATHGYQPLLGTEESARAQIKLGVEAHKGYFGKAPRGIWLPECAYRPRYKWRSPVEDDAEPFERAGTDELLAENGIEYFFVDSHMIRGGQPLGTYAANFPQLAELFARSSRYFTPPEEFRSEYEHYLLPSGLTAFARDPETTVKVWSGESGYPGDARYLEFHKQQYPGRLKYWRISEDKADLGEKKPYDPYAAFEALESHANDLVTVLKATLARYRGQSDRKGTLVAMYDTELFGHWWWEGPEFLYELARAIHKDGELECVSGGDVMDTDPARHMITLPEGSWGEGGYHYVWINEDNWWTWKQLYECERRMRTLSGAPAHGPAREIVTQAGRELLLAEASDWQFLISTRSAKDYSEARFTDHIARFTRLADLAEAVHAGREPTEEESAFVTECRTKDAPFSDLDPTLWAVSSPA